jgi:hypothetical protein
MPEDVEEGGIARATLDTNILVSAFQGSESMARS